MEYIINIFLSYFVVKVAVLYFYLSTNTYNYYFIIIVLFIYLFFADSVFERSFFLGISHSCLQSNQVKRTPMDCIIEPII